MLRVVTAVAFGLVGLVVTGCATNGVFSKKYDGNDPVTYLGTNAESRVVVTSQVGPYSRPGMVDPSFITCTEPSPDVATAVSRSLELAITAAAKGTASLSGAEAESLAQLAERTASVQLLRDKLYQSCLAYQNGAISGVTYTLIMSRLDDAIVTLLMGETAGGAFGRSGAVLGGGASGSASGSAPAVVQQLGGVEKAAAKLAESQSKLDETIAARDGKQKDCDAALADEAEKPAAEQKQRKDLAICAETDGLTKQVNKQQQELQQLKGLLDQQISAATNAAAQTTTVQGMGGRAVTPDAAVSRVLEEMQDNFLNADVSASVIPACLVELGLQNAGQEDFLFQAEASYARVVSIRREIADRELELDELDPNAKDYRSRKVRLESLQSASHDVLKAAISDADAKLRNAATMLQQRQGSFGAYHDLFEAMHARWKALEEDGAFIDALEYASGAAAMTRRSSLAAFCSQNLPSLVEHIGKNAQSYRNARLNAEANVRLAAEKRAYIESHTAMLAALPTALKECEKFAEKNRDECRLRLLPAVQAEKASQ